MKSHRTGIVAPNKRPLGFAHEKREGERVPFDDVYRYGFVPGHNETLKVLDPHGLEVTFYNIPKDIQAEIKISMGQAGLMYSNLPWRKRFMFDVAAWWDGLRETIGI